MKMPDLSKKALGTFFLHHTEKLILGLCLVLFGVFFWLGFKAKPYDKSDPEKLVKLADSAEAYIVNAEHWEEIQPHRLGKKDVLERIRKAEGEGKLDASQYRLDLLSGIAAKTKNARTDPQVIAPKDLRAVSWVSPMLITMSRAFTDPYSGLKLVEASTEAAGGGFGGGLGGGPGDDFGGEDGGDAEDGGGDEFGGGLGGGGRGGLGGPGASAARAKDDTVPPIDAGDQYMQVNAHTDPSVNGVSFGIAGASTKPYVVSVVCVTATVDFSAQVKQFEKFSDSIGFYPGRDKPIYQEVQVERRLKGTKKWIDRTKEIQFDLPRVYPAMHKMPMALNSSAPEFVKPVYWDPVLTGSIPPVAIDYRSYVTHPALEGMREFPKFEIEEAEEEDPDFLGGSGTDEPGGTGLGGGRGMGGPGLGGGMGGGLGGPGLGGGMGGGLGGSRGGGMGGGLGGATGEEAKQTRVATDFTDYIKMLQSKEQTSKLKLVRFFDVDINNFKQGGVYEYRVRVWIGDPNNEDPSMTFVNNQGGHSTPAGGLGGRGGFGMGSGDGEEDPGDEEEEGEGGPGMPNSGADDAEKAYVKIPITSTMKVPNVRKRLNLATSTENPKTKLNEYTIAEIRKRTTKNAAGEEVVTEEVEIIKIPKDREYLRFARPSEWSEVTEVEIATDRSVIAAGSVLPGRSVKLKMGGKDAVFSIEEPVAEMAVGTYSDKYGTPIPTKQSVFRGDLMNYFAAAHILNPITWRVYVTKNESELAVGEDKYRVPIRSQKVVVDAMVGEPLNIRGAKMKFSMASEVLVMDEKGNFTVQNEVTDRTTYRNLLLQPDEKQSYGKKKRSKKKDDEPGGGGRGGMGGGLGGGPGSEF